MRVLVEFAQGSSPHQTQTLLETIVLRATALYPPRLFLPCSCFQTQFNHVGPESTAAQLFVGGSRELHHICLL